MSAIKKGDLVIVVRGNGCTHCGPISVGVITVVTYVGIPSDGKCAACGGVISDPGIILASCENGKYYETSRLKKIPPITEPETVERKDEVTA